MPNYTERGAGRGVVWNLGWRFAYCAFVGFGFGWSRQPCIGIGTLYLVLPFYQVEYTWRLR